MTARQVLVSLDELPALNRGRRSFAAVLRLEKRKRVPVQPPAVGFTSVPDGEEFVRVQLELNVEGLVHLLGPKAARSAGKRSALQGGLVVAKVSGRDPVPQGGAS